MVRVQEKKADLHKSILFTLEESKYSNDKVIILLDQIKKQDPDFELYSITRYRDKKDYCFIEILFQRKCKV